MIGLVAIRPGIISAKAPVSDARLVFEYLTLLLQLGDLPSDLPALLLESLFLAYLHINVIVEQVPLT